MESMSTVTNLKMCLNVSLLLIFSLYYTPFFLSSLFMYFYHEMVTVYLFFALLIHLAALKLSMLN